MRCRLVGVGGCGCKVMQHLLNQGLLGVDYKRLTRRHFDSDIQCMVMDTDAQALEQTSVASKLQIGKQLTAVLVAGGDLGIGRLAALENREEIKQQLQGVWVTIIITGMGGGTGTGATPVIADIAREAGAFTIAVVTKPLNVEGTKRSKITAAALPELSQHVDSLIVFDNQKIADSVSTEQSIVNTFQLANNEIFNALMCICYGPFSSYIGFDWSDVEMVLRGQGYITVVHSVGQGKNFIEDAFYRTFKSPLIDQVDLKSITGAGVLVFVRVSPNFSITLWAKIDEEVQNWINEEADLKYCMLFDEKFSVDQIEFTIFLAGLQG